MLLAMTARIFLLLNVALAFYNVGTIWAHEVDIFRTWKLIDKKDFLKVQTAHWHKLPFWVFIPVGLALAGTVALIWYHPVNSPLWGIWGVLVCQSLSLVLTSIFWGRWQASLSKDLLGSGSPYLLKILKTHWVRTFLVSLNALIFLVWAIIVLS